MITAGTQIEGYSILRVEADGGMSDVYEAQEILGGRRVAFKVMHPAWSSDRALVTRFENEASILGGIRHPHVISLLKAGRLPEGTPYMVLEWLPGNLARALSGGRRVEVGRALRLSLQITSALLALHQRGIVHRDLKPANILLDVEDLERAELRLADLGLAKARPAPGAGPIALGHVSTGGNAFLGTYDYMAPEQWIQSKTVEAKADVYSLGVLLFQMLAGRLPFVAEQAKELMALHLFETPPMHLLEGIAPEGLRKLLERMLGKKLSGRPSLSEVIEALSALRSS